MRRPGMFGMAVAGLGVMLFVGPLYAADAGRGTEPKHMKEEEMKSRRAQIRAGMEERQGKLDDLAARMNQATGQEKVEAMAALLNEMVAQRKAMRERMAEGMEKRKGKGEREDER